MEFKTNLMNEEEKLFLQIVGTNLERSQKTISDMEEDVQNDKTGNLKKLQDEFRTYENVLLKFLYGNGFSTGFSRYVYNKNESLISDIDKYKYTEDDIYNNIAEFVMLYDTSDYPIMDKDDVIKDVKILWNKLS